VANLEPGPVKIEAYVDKALATPKETIIFEVVFRYPADLGATPPEFFSQIGGMRVLDVDENDPTPDERDPTMLVAKRRLQLKADLTGTYILPAIHWPYTYQGKNYEAVTGEIFLEISAEGTGQDARVALSKELKDLKPLRLPHAPWKNAVAIVWILWALGILLIIWRLRAARKIKVKVVLPREQVQLDLKALKNLLALEAWDASVMKTLAFGISAALRNYAEAEFKWPVREATWPQIQGIADTAWPDLLVILEPLEVVKFSKVVWPQQAAAASLDAAQTWVEKNTVRPQTPSAKTAQKDEDFL
jgi:hypothetical protein